MNIRRDAGIGQRRGCQTAPEYRGAPSGDLFSDSLKAIAALLTSTAFFRFPTKVLLFRTLPGSAIFRDVDQAPWSKYSRLPRIAFTRSSNSKKSA